MSFSRLVSLSAGAVAAGSAYLFGVRYFDTVEGDDPFAKHTVEQQKKFPFSGMHEPYIANTNQRALFMRLFPDRGHLLPTLEELRAQREMRTPVTFLPLNECPVPIGEVRKVKKIVVGGPPAFIPWANEPELTVINDDRQPGIVNGSAFHLEWDSPSEAPTSYPPSHFVARQIARLFRPITLKSAEQTGLFPWRSLDWCGWLKHPRNWFEGLRIGFAFEKATQLMKDPVTRAKLVQEVAGRCRANEKFYEKLNQSLNGQLFLPGKGSIIVARTPEEVSDLIEMKADEEREGRKLIILSKQELLERYGFALEGLCFAEKTHDRIFNPNWRQLLAKRVESLGGTVINGTVKAVYADSEEEGGVVRFTSIDGKEQYLSYSALLGSLGCQRLLGRDQEPIFDIVAARGVSVLSMAYLPEGQELHPSIVCGATNHVTTLSGPIPWQGEDGKKYSLYLLRITAAACITPNSTEAENAKYDAGAATGLIAAVQKTIGCRLDVLAVQGCNRQVGPWGQMHWISPFKKAKRKSLLAPRGQELDVGTHLPAANRPATLFQVGPGGGGITQAPSQPPNADALAASVANLKLEKS